MNYFLIILIVALVMLVLRAFRNPIRKWLARLRAKLQIMSLRKAIYDADKNKEKNDRKNMVIFNTHSGKFEPIEKKALKTVAKKSKNKNNAALTPGRKRALVKKKRLITTRSAKQLEKKSLYVTK